MSAAADHKFGFAVGRHPAFRLALAIGLSSLVGAAGRADAQSAYFSATGTFTIATGEFQDFNFTTQDTSSSVVLRPSALAERSTCPAAR